MRRTAAVYLTHTPTTNPQHGFTGTIRNAGLDPTSSWLTALNCVLVLLVRQYGADDRLPLLRDVARDFLDSTHGRHLADVVVEGGPEAIAVTLGAGRWRQTLERFALERTGFNG